MQQSYVRHKADSFSLKIWNGIEFSYIHCVSEKKHADELFTITSSAEQHFKTFMFPTVVQQGY